jgi:hypothetical protein
MQQTDRLRTNTSPLPSNPEHFSTILEISSVPPFSPPLVSRHRPMSPKRSSVSHSPNRFRPLRAPPPPPSGRTFPPTGLGESTSLFRPFPVRKSLPIRRPIRKIRYKIDQIPSKNEIKRMCRSSRVRSPRETVRDEEEPPVSDSDAVFSLSLSPDWLFCDVVDRGPR